MWIRKFEKSLDAVDCLLAIAAAHRAQQQLRPKADAHTFFFGPCMSACACRCAPQACALPGVVVLRLAGLKSMSLGASH